MVQIADTQVIAIQRVLACIENVLMPELVDFGRGDTAQPEIGRKQIKEPAIATFDEVGAVRFPSLAVYQLLPHWLKVEFLDGAPLGKVQSRWVLKRLLR